MALANRIVSFLVKTRVLDSDNKDIYEYGTFVLLNHVIMLAFTLVFSKIFELKYELLGFFLITIFLRSNSGGFNFKKYYKCVILSILELFLLAFIFSKLDFYIENIFLWNFLLSFILLQLSPVDTLNRRLDNFERKLVKKKLFLFLIVFYIASVIFYNFGYSKSPYIFSISLIHCLLLLFFGIIDNRRV